MPPQELRAAVRRQPFVPFRLHLTDGRAFDVPHPEMLLVMARYAVVAIYPGGQMNGQAFPERSETIALIHVVSLEPLIEAA